MYRELTHAHVSSFSLFLLPHSLSVLKESIVSSVLYFYHCSAFSFHAVKFVAIVIRSLLPIVVILLAFLPLVRHASHRINFAWIHLQKYTFFNSISTDLVANILWLYLLFFGYGQFFWLICSDLLWDNRQPSTQSFPPNQITGSG